MEHEEFIEQVQLNLLNNHALRLSQTETVAAIEAVLQTLAEQLSAEDRTAMARSLPPALQDFWRDAGTAQSLTYNAFFDRIAERESIDVTVAAYYVRAVLETLSETLSTEDLELLRARLPARFSPLFNRGAGDDLNLSV